MRSEEREPHPPALRFHGDEQATYPQQWVRAAEGHKERPGAFGLFVSPRGGGWLAVRAPSRAPGGGRELESCNLCVLYPDRRWRGSGGRVMRIELACASAPPCSDRKWGEPLLLPAL
jgi:hypothetical protein